MTHSLRFSVPWPPTVNTYWDTITLPIKGKPGKRRASVILSARAKDYRLLVAAAVRNQRVACGVLSGKLQLHFDAFPPDRRERDLDNLFKGMLDSLVHAGVMRNDSEIDDLRIVRRHVIPGGTMQVYIAEIAGEATESADLFEPLKQAVG
jgi:crossover junction endodeoxyribonuclease RusA